VSLPKVTGLTRWWRLCVLAALISWLFGDLMWWTAGGPHAGATAPPLGIIAYFLISPLLLVAMALLVHAGGGLKERWRGQIGQVVVITVLDALVATIAFAILVFIAGLGGKTGVALPRSTDTTVVFAYSILELVVVVIAVLLAMGYRSDRPYRLNFLLLVGGMVAVAAADRMVAYLQNTGVTGGQSWGGIGFVLGPLLVAFAVGVTSEDAGKDRLSAAWMDFAQLALPFIGFLGIAALFTFHVLTGNGLTPTLVWVTVVMVVCVAMRQMVAMNAQRSLTRRLYETQLRLAHQVRHDALTGLPNRLLFSQRLEQAMRDGRFVLIFVDLDDFKEINDRYGHAAGDDLLRAVGQRLQRCLSERDTLARIGGDEFAILIDSEEEPAEVVADRIRLMLRGPFAVHGSSVRVRASMGLVDAGAHDPSLTSDDLLRQADSSMYAGKRLGKDTAVVYRPTAGFAADFPSALRRANGGVPEGFSMVYQPIVRLPEMATVAVEALSRWTAPNGTQIGPETFVGAAEAAGLGATLDALVLDLACREITESGLKVDLHVNIGATRLGNPAFEDLVRRSLERYDLDPGRLVLEITETVPIVDLGDAGAQIGRLRALGVKVALDDFGAGYSSLIYLHTLPVQIVKLDRSLAVGVNAGSDATLYRSVIGLCDALQFDVIAEGIESDAQAEMVYRAGCSLVQGHLFGRPIPMADLISPVVRSQGG